MTAIEFPPDKELDAVRDFVLQKWTLGETHGISHWQRVERNGLLLSVEKRKRDGKWCIRKDVNLKVVRYFAYLHDSCRLNDWHDIKHGARAAEMIQELRNTLLADLNDNEIALLEKACRLHTVAHRTGNPTVDVCFDADRLDFIRVRIIPNPSKMATEQGAYYASHPNRKRWLLSRLAQIGIDRIIDCR